jgi:hypothetical protein
MTINEYCHFCFKNIPVEYNFDTFDEYLKYRRYTHELFWCNDCKEKFMNMLNKINTKK